ncbi:hypothetical protein LSAT2_013445, partial [Lamellibrachia satsuma]
VRDAMERCDARCSGVVRDAIERCASMCDSHHSILSPIAPSHRAPLRRVAKFSAQQRWPFSAIVQNGITVTNKDTLHLKCHITGTTFALQVIVACVVGKGVPDGDTDRKTIETNLSMCQYIIIIIWSKDMCMCQCIIIIIWSKDMCMCQCIIIIIWSKDV